MEGLEASQRPYLVSIWGWNGRGKVSSIGIIYASLQHPCDRIVNHGISGAALYKRRIGYMDTYLGFVELASRFSNQYLETKLLSTRMSQ